MKKIFALTVAVLCYFCTYSQEAKESGNYPTLIIMPRFEVNPYLSTGSEGYKGVDFGNTSLCSLFEGSIGEHFSYSMSNHWLTTETKPLYQDILRSDESDFIDWLTISYTLGRFTFTAGKDMIAIGGYELDPMDVDQHGLLCSTLYQTISIFQLCGAVGYTSKDERTFLSLQFGASPFSMQSFKDKLFSYSLIWYGDYDWFAPIWSANLIEYERGRFVKIAALGNGLYFGNFGAEIDLVYKNSNLDGQNHEFSAIGKFSYTIKDKFEIFARAGYEYRSRYDIFGYEDEYVFNPTYVSNNKNYAFYGGGVHYYPLKNSTDLRLHLFAAANNYTKSVALSLGATYHFNLTDIIRKHK